MKNYKKNAYNTTVTSIFQQIDKEDWNLYNDLINKGFTEKDKGYFINAFNQINKITHFQFFNIPPYFRKYYSTFFKNKVIILYNKIMKNIKNKEFKSLSDKLLKHFIKSNITKDITKSCLYNVIGWRHDGEPIIKLNNK